MELPKTFTCRSGNFKHLNGRPKLSYSQYNSYNDPEYKYDYYVQYFMGFKIAGNDFSTYGGSVGEYIEHKAIGEEKRGVLSDEDVQFLDEMIDYPANSVYEDEVALDLGEFVVEGYIDRTHYDFNNIIHIRDYKSGNLLTKADYYASDEYQQTTIYCYFKEKQGFKIGTSEVFMVGRKGNSLEGKGNFKMRLSGEHLVIPTPYSTERGEKAIKSLKDTAKKISDEYKIYLKIFGDNGKN